jgi:hypothetical protein
MENKIGKSQLFREQNRKKEKEEEEEGEEEDEGGEEEETEKQNRWIERKKERSRCEEEQEVEEKEQGRLKFMGYFILFFDEKFPRKFTPSTYLHKYTCIRIIIFNKIFIPSMGAYPLNKIPPIIN